MRISTSTMNKIMTGSISNAYETYMDIMNKIASKKNFTKVSQNPSDASKVLKLKDSLSQLEQYQSNIQAANTEMNTAYDTLGNIIDDIGSINSLVTQAANGTTSTSEAQAYADEIRGRVDSIIDKLNTKYLDNYIFSGTYTQNRTYVKNEDGDIIYQGSKKEASDRNLTIAEGKTFTYNLSAQDIFGKDTDFFSQMKELDELLTADTLDNDAIRKKLDVLEEAVKQVSQAQGEISNKVTKLTNLSEDNEKTILKLTEDRSDLEDIDIIKAASDLMNAQQALQASYAIGSQIMGSVSLLDYI